MTTKEATATQFKAPVEDRIVEIRERHAACERDPQYAYINYKDDPDGIVATAMIAQGHTDRFDLLTELTASQSRERALTEKVKSLIELLDNQLGTPCEQIRHQQEVEALTSENKALTAQRDAMARSSAIAEIAAERLRQISAEGWTHEHDDLHTDNELSKAGACYALGDIRVAAFFKVWPENWDVKWWKPTNRRRNLIKAAALIVAEIERLDRAALQQSQEKSS